MLEMIMHNHFTILYQTKLIAAQVRAPVFDEVEKIGGK